MHGMSQEPVRLVIAPNASLRPVQAVGCFAAICALPLLIAVLFAARGYWPVLPFAGLELAALGAGLWVSVRAGRCREVVCVNRKAVTIGFGRVGQGPTARCELDRYATRAFIEAPRRRNGSGVLVLSSCGQRVEIGRCLTEAERLALCRRIKELLAPGSARSPAAHAGNAPVEF